VIVTGAVLVVGPVCKAAETPSERIVGIWEFTGMHNMGRIVYRRDGTIIELFRQDDRPGAYWIPTWAGKWRIEGNTIVAETNLLGEKAEAPRVTRGVIAAFQPDRLVSGDGHSDSVRVTLAVARSSEAAIIIRVLISLILCATSVYAAVKSSFHRIFAIIASGAACLFISSVLSVPREFGQTGDIVVAYSVVEALQVPRDLLDSLAVLLLGGGSAWLAVLLARRRGQLHRDCNF
jgi:hypothetical protein